MKKKSRVSFKYCTTALPGFNQSLLDF